MKDLPEHTSFSSLSSYSKCPKAWQLERVVKVPQGQGWARLGGSAVHTATEVYDRAGDEVKCAEDLFADAFRHEIEEAKKLDSNIDAWLPSGRVTKEWPNRKGQEWWWHHGPIFVQRWIDWRHNTPWNLAVMPDQAQGIELEFKPIIGGRPVKMFVDRLFEAGEFGQVVVDLKTGDPRFTDNLQLALYAEGVFQSTGIRPRYGAFWYAQTGDIGGLVDLKPWTASSLGLFVERFYENLAADRFEPRVSNLCNACSVREGCLAYGGQQANTYDPAWDEIMGEAA